MPLTDTAIRNLEPREKPFKLADSAGLFLLVNPGGSRLWRFKYRYNGREKLLALGSYPLVGLKAARSKRDEARLLLVDGRDPSEERKVMRRTTATAKENSFRDIAAEYFRKLEIEGRAQQTLAKTRWLLDAAEKTLGNFEVSSIRTTEVLDAVRRFEDEGKHESATRLRSTIGAVIRYAIATGRAVVDPTASLKGALIRPTVTPRAAIIEKKKLGRLILAIRGMGGEPATRTGLLLLAMLAPRPGELRLATWDEFDLDAATWRIPSERTKMRRPHSVPLPSQALSLLEDHARLRGHGDFLLPSVRGWQKPMSENTLNHALRRLGFGRSEATGHGFRASFSTIANESGLWHADAIERALGHVEGNDVRRAYARGEHWDERVRMSQWWADQLDEFAETARK